MKRIWNRKLSTQSPWEPQFSGVFFSQPSGISFYYEDGGTVKSISGCSDAPVTLLPPTPGLPLPRKWMLVEQADDRFLMCGEEIAIRLGSDLPVDPVPDRLRMEYRRRRSQPGHLVEDAFSFGDYQIFHKGEWGYVCRKNGEALWKFSGHGYLYTEMFCKGDHLCFGTAGAGGYFYILDLPTGAPVLRLQTGGTTVVLQEGGRGYLYTGVGKRKSQLVCIDFSTGETLDTIDLPGTATADSVLGMWDGCIYTVTFQYEKWGGSVRNAVFSCSSLADLENRY